MYYRWKTARWSDGNEFAFLGDYQASAIVLSAKKPGEPREPIFVRAEEIWHRPLLFESEFERLSAIHCRFYYLWKGDAKALMRAIKRVRSSIETRRGDSAEAHRTRVDRVGAPLMEALQSHFPTLARSLELPQENGGRYFSSMRRSEIIQALKRIDPVFNEFADRTIQQALPAFVRTIRGRRSRS